MFTEQHAENLARQAHKGQFRNNGDEYITHPQRVAKMGKTLNERVVGWLHDVIEDTHVTYKDLGDWGFSQEVIDAVEHLTKREGESYCDFIYRVRYNRLASQVKIYDLTDNLSDHKRGARKDKYELAKRILEERLGI